MNSNWKLLSAGLLVAALAGCGGGSGDDEMEMPPTPEEACAAMGQGYAIDSDGECKSLDDAREEGADAEGDKRDQEDADEQAAADAKAAQEAAQALRAALVAAIGGARDGDLTANPGDDYFVNAVPAAAALRGEDAHMSMSVAVMGEPFNEEYTLTNGSITLTANTGDFPYNRAKASAFSTSGSKNHSNNTLVDGNARFRTTGTYHGVAGTFTCAPRAAGTPCSSDVSGTQEFTLANGEWTFTPSSASANVMDGNAAKYGWWTDDIGKATREARVYFGAGDDAEPRTDFGGGGKATYKGEAVGQYAIHRGVGADNDSGAFTADATIEANFASTGATVSGMIDGFMGADGNARDWTVELQRASLASGVWAPEATTGTTTPGTTVWTMDGDNKAAAAGGWNGAMYGGSTTATPTAVAGAFAAEHGNIGNMIGAFGAAKE